MNEPIRYWLDRADRIVEVNAVWDEFARLNDAPHLAAGDVVGRELWDSIVDSTTRHPFSAMLERVRRGQRIEYPYRCDSPACRRHMHMTVTADADRVRFESRIVSAAPRHPQALIDVSARRRSDLLTVCSWCKRVRAGSQWLEIEEAVPALALFENDALPRLTHGICADCEADVMSALTT